MAEGPWAPPFPFQADKRIMAQHGGALLQATDGAKSEEGRVLGRAGTHRGDRRSSRQSQFEAEAIRMDNIRHPLGLGSVLGWGDGGRGYSASWDDALRPLREVEIRGLAEEALGVFEENLVDLGGALVALLHFEATLDDGEGVGNAPVAGGVQPEPGAVVGLQDVDGAVRGALALRVEGEAGPVALVLNDPDGVFFDVVDDDLSAVEL